MLGTASDHVRLTGARSTRSECQYLWYVNQVGWLAGIGDRQRPDFWLSQGWRGLGGYWLDCFLVPKIWILDRFNGLVQPTFINRSLLGCHWCVHHTCGAVARFCSIAHFLELVTNQIFFFLLIHVIFRLPSVFSKKHVKIIRAKWTSKLVAPDPSTS